jgi:hypothetical protein
MKKIFTHSFTMLTVIFILNQNCEASSLLNSYQVFQFNNSNSVLARANDDGISVVLIDARCPFSNISNTYRYKATIRKSGTTIDSCYSIDHPREIVMMADTFSNNFEVPFIFFGMTSKPVSGKSTLGAIGDALNSIGDGIAGAQRFQQPPPGFVYVAPGVSRSNYMQCTPDGRGGYYCK